MTDYCWALLYCVCVCVCVCVCHCPTVLRLWGGSFHGTRDRNIDSIVQNNFSLKKISDSTGNDGVSGPVCA